MAKKGQRGRRDALGDPMIPLIRRARQQVEVEPGGPLGWLVRFVREDPDTWLPGDVEAHGHRLLALVYGPLPPNQVRRGSGNIPALTPTSVVETHAELGEFFRTLVGSPAGEVKVPADGLEVVLVRATEPGEKPAIFGVGRGGPRRTLLFQAVQALILESDRLIACPKCGEPFLALRKRKFCTSVCLQGWHDAKRPKKGDAR